MAKTEHETEGKYKTSKADLQAYKELGKNIREFIKATRLEEVTGVSREDAERVLLFHTMACDRAYGRHPATN